MYIYNIIIGAFLVSLSLSLHASIIYSSSTPSHLLSMILFVVVVVVVGVVAVL